MHGAHAACALALAALTGCTSVNTASLPQGRNDIYVTTGDVKEPYTSLGIVQATRKGAIAFGFWDPAGTDVQSGVNDLVAEARAMNADAVINVRFEQTQYNPAARILGLIFFIVPLPSEVTVRGEVIRLGAPTRNDGPKGGVNL